MSISLVYNKAMIVLDFLIDWSKIYTHMLGLRVGLVSEIDKKLDLEILFVTNVV